MSPRPITFRAQKTSIHYGGGVAKWGPRGIAYEENGFFVCMHAHAHGLRGVSPGYAFTQKSDGSLSDWVTNVFGASEIMEMRLEPGQCFRRLWRPGIDGLASVTANLVPSGAALNQAGIALSLLVQKFETLSRFIELDVRNLEAFSHMTRELLIWCCTEVETSLRSVLVTSDALRKDQRFTTNDYAHLCGPLFLREYEATLRHYETISSFGPSKNWDVAKPTTSLPWYDAYNAVKHDREGQLHRATLRHCIEAFAAAAILYCAQFSIPIGPDWTHEPSYSINQWLRIELINADPSTFYVPAVNIPANRVPELWLFDGRDTVVWKPEPLAI